MVRAAIEVAAAGRVEPINASTTVVPDPPATGITHMPVPLEQAETLATEESLTMYVTGPSALFHASR